MPGALEIQAVGLDEIDTIAAILDEATRWVRGRGGQQWPLPFPRERLLERLAIGEVYLAWLDGAPVGTFSLQPADPLFWGETPPDALYLHGLAIRRAVAGCGVGQQLVRWSEQRVRAVGRQYLRLDCQAGNPAIRRYYEQQGFVDRGEVVAYERRFRLLEKLVQSQIDRCEDGGMSRPLSASAQRVQDTLVALGFPYQVQESEQVTRTAAEAAAVVGCTVGQIAKSLIFKARASDRGVLVITSGANRVAETLIATELGEPITKADAEFVREQTGFAIGGIPPLGHRAPLVIFIDQDLLQYDLIWAAAGTPNALFQLVPGDLVRMTGGRVVAVH